MSSVHGCKRVVFHQNEIRDKLTPIVVEANYTLFENRPQRGSQLRPILDAYEPEVIRGKVSFNLTEFFSQIINNFQFILDGHTEGLRYG